MAGLYNYGRGFRVGLCLGPRATWTDTCRGTPAGDSGHYEGRSADTVTAARAAPRPRTRDSASDKPCSGSVTESLRRRRGSLSGAAAARRTYWHGSVNVPVTPSSGSGSRA